MALADDRTTDPLLLRLQAAVGAAYQVRGLLGRGGFGVVVAAEEAALRRAVAIKVLRPEIAAPVIRERFRREAEAAAALQHPGIIPIYGIGESADLCWFIMPEVRGETLRERLVREGRLTIPEVRRILLETTRALGAAHAAGILHRDIKPDNILLDGGDRRVVLTDFGIAKSLLPAAAAAGSAPLTTVGMVLGTPDYMSPEQASGEATLDQRSDLYSLGVLAYELLTGRRPFEAASPGSLLLRQLQEAAPPVRRLRPECPEALADAVARCLEREPAARWDSAEALVAALGRGSSALVRPSGSTTRDPGWSSRSLLAAAALVLLAAAIADISLRAPTWTPPALVISAAILASHHGSRRRLGQSWRSIWLPHAESPGYPLAPAGDAAQQARSDRAQLLRDLESFSRAERALVPGLSREVDRLVAEVERRAESTPERKEAARRLGQLRRLVAEGRALGLSAVLDELGALVPGVAGSVHRAKVADQGGEH